MMKGRKRSVKDSGQSMTSSMKDQGNREETEAIDYISKQGVI